MKDTCSFDLIYTSADGDQAGSSGWSHLDAGSGGQLALSPVGECGDRAS